MISSAANDGLLQLNHDLFDFNINFEQLFFSIIPSSLFIVTSCWRTWVQVQRPTVVHAPVLQLVKLGAITSYVGLELALLILAATGTTFVASPLFMAASTLKLVSAFFMTVLSVIDHSRSLRPSSLLNGYLLLVLILDAAQARTLFLSASEKPEFAYSSIFVAAMAVKVAILLLEAQRKSKWLVRNEEPRSPEETSGIFSLGVFFWMNKLFLAGYGKVLTMVDLYPLDRSFDAESLHEEFTRRLETSRPRSDRYGLAKVLARQLRGPLLLSVAPRLAFAGFTLCQPLFIEKLIDHLSKPKIETNVGYGFIGASFLIYFGMAISRSFYWYFHHRTRTMIRSILVTEIYNKATKMKIGVAGDAALTLMSTDMERIRSGMVNLHEVWAGTLEAALASWMLYSRLGLVFLAPIGIILAGTICLGILMIFTGDSQRAWMAAVQKRVGLTATVIGSMKNLKISGLSITVQDFLQKLRVNELHTGARFQTIVIISAVFAFVPELFSAPLTFAFSQRTLDASTMFTSLSFITLLVLPISLIIQSTPQLVAAVACLGRIQTFLQCENRQDFRQILADFEAGGRSQLAEDRLSSNPEDAVLVRNGKFGWEPGNFVLNEINTRIPKSSLTMVVGAVGSGKSTFSKALLGEVPFSRGSLIMATRVSHLGFCDQTPVLLNGSIRENITGYSPFDFERYTKVVEATALGYDLKELPQGDQTNIGSDGVSLSGGQKQRVSLARALYLQTDFLVLDDIFSGLDANTEEQVFRNVFGLGGLLRRRKSTVVLCTHSVKHLAAADSIIAFENGTIAQQGSFQDLIATPGYIQRLGLEGLAKDTSSSGDTTPEDLAQRTELDGTISTITNIVDAAVHDIDSSRQVGDKAVYKYYIQQMGWFLATCALVSGISWGFFTNFPTIWLTYWTNDNSHSPRHPFAYYAGVYFALQACATISLLTLGCVLYVTALKKAGARLHHSALRALIKAPLAFFTKTDTGVVTNLFSQDLNLIDTELPEATLSTLWCVFQAMGQAAVMLTSSLYLGISYPFLFGLLYIVQKFYLRTSRQLRLLDLEAKSPLYTHFLDTVKGIATLRAFGFISDDIKKNARLINTSQRPAYLLLIVQEWLNLVLNIVVMIMAVALTTLAVQMHSNSAFAGASLFSLLSFGANLSGIVTNFTILETSLGAVARLKAFSEKTAPEDRDEEDIAPPEQWPHAGVVELKGVRAYYNSPSNLALRDIHLTINAGEKIAICGRTGSGKSSLIAFLLKLLEPVSDSSKSAYIDEMPLHRINRNALRQGIIAVPQEAVFLSEGASFRENLDPYYASTSEQCQSVLVSVGLWDFVQDRGGLDASMNASTFSAGQRQLISFGRALLRRHVRSQIGTDTGILLLDEVSSSVDHETERIMLDIIRTEFSNYTVIAVSHRLDMIMDFDRVVVMDRGEIVEVGPPRSLAGQASTRFGELVRAGC